MSEYKVDITVHMVTHEEADTPTEAVIKAREKLKCKGKIVEYKTVTKEIRREIYDDII